MTLQLRTYSMCFCRHLMRKRERKIRREIRECVSIIVNFAKLTELRCCFKICVHKSIAKLPESIYWCVVSTHRFLQAQKYFRKIWRPVRRNSNQTKKKKKGKKHSSWNRTSNGKKKSYFCATITKSVCGLYTCKMTIWCRQEIFKSIRRQTTTNIQQIAKKISI